MRRKELSVFGFAAWFGLLLSTAGVAEPGRDLLLKASDAFAKRAAQEDDPAVLDTIALLKDVAGSTAVTPEELADKYQSLMLLARAYYTAGTLVPYDERSGSEDNLRRKTKRLNLLEQGRQAASAGQQIDDKHAESYYYYALNLARWANTKGVGESLDRRKELSENLIRAKTKFTIDGKKGETLDGFGPLRTEGRAAYKLPPGFGQNKNLSYSDLKTAAEKAPYVAANQIYYASTLRWMGKNDSQGRSGKQILEALVGDAQTAQAAADKFIAGFVGTPFEELAKSRTAETLKDFLEDIKEPAGYLGVSIPWLK